MRILHTMLRVRDLGASIRFYTETMGMTLLRREDFPGGRFTLAFVGYEDEGLQDLDQATGAVIELTHNWDVDDYRMGDAFGHVAIQVDDVYRACEAIKNRGGKVIREAGPMQHGRVVIAFVEDPDGYKLELVQAS